MIRDIILFKLLPNNLQIFIPMLSNRTFACNHLFSVDSSLFLERKTIST